MGFIDSLDFRINGQKANWHPDPVNIDICEIILLKALKPGDALVITTPFHVKIPKGVSSRLGHIGQSYQISQWYPKPAVYDQQGWHQMPYLDQGEFYSEFGDYEVSITLPSNYVVGSTGILQDQREKEFLNKIAADTKWIDNPESDVSFPSSSKIMKTLHYKEKNIHDFAWFADKRFHVKKGQHKLPWSGKEISTMVMFTNEQAQLWSSALDYLNNAIDYFSRIVGDYPYDTFTAVQSSLSAGSGMEYPEITVIGLTKNAYALDEVIAHETAHSWFYAALGFNERRYPFLDEGITSAYEFRYMEHFYPGKKLWEAYFRKYKFARFFHLDKIPIHRVNELEWLIQARSNLEQPLNLSSTDFTAVNYERMLYDKAPLAYNYLRAYLSDSLFDSIMQDFYRKEKFTHPQPDDLRSYFESGSKSDLSWFFEDLIGTTKRLDYKLKRLNNDSVLVRNKGELISPLVIAGKKGDSIISKRWYEGFEKKRWVHLSGNNYTGLQIDPNHKMPEIYRLNNYIRQGGILKTAAPLRTQFYLTLEDPDKSTLMYFPVVNWTRENSLMIGMAFHNGVLLPKRFEYFLMPFYAFNSSLAGYGKITYNILPYERFYRMLSFTLEGTRFGAPGDQNYHKIKTGVDLYFRANEGNNPIRHKIYSYYIAASDLQKILKKEKTQLRSYWQGGYYAEKNTLINPFNLSANLEYSPSYLKTSGTVNYRISYNGANRGLDFRIFTGKMIHYKSGNAVYGFSPNGRTGRDEYLYQGTFPDRFAEFPHSFWSRQMNLSEGGLITPVSGNLGFSDWLVSLSLTSHIPGKAGMLPVKPFLNLLLNDHGLNNSHDSRLFFEGGIKAGIWNFFEVYFPLIVSGNISSVSGSLKDRIRFIFKLDLILHIRKTGVT